MGDFGDVVCVMQGFVGWRRQLVYAACDYLRDACYATGARLQLYDMENSFGGACESRSLVHWWSMARVRRKRCFYLFLTRRKRRGGK